MEDDADEDCVVRVVTNGMNFPLRITCKTWTVPTEICDNIRTNVARSTPRLLNRVGLAQVQSEPLAIVGGGPSLRRTLGELRDFKKILACGSVHDYLVDNGIIPSFCAVADSIPTMKDCLRQPQHECIYAIASQCHPSMFDALDGYKIEMWHFKGQVGSEEEERKLLGLEPSICCGCTVGLNSMYLALLLGYQHLHFFGFDSCYEENLSHAYHMDDLREVQTQTVTIEGSDRPFLTDMGMIAQAEQFYKIVGHNGLYFHSYIHGDGLIAEMARTGNETLKQFVTVVTSTSGGESYPQKYLEPA